MKYIGINSGWLVEEFVPWPSCGIRWMRLKDGKYWDVMFSFGLQYGEMLSVIGCFPVKK